MYIRNKLTENNPEESFLSLLNELQITLNCGVCDKSWFIEGIPSGDGKYDDQFNTFSTYR